MDDEFQKQFTAVADAFYDAVPTLQENILPEMQRLQQAHTEVTNKINAGREASKTTEITSIFTATRAAEHALYDNTFNVVTNGLTPIVGSHPTPPREPDWETASPDELGAAMAELAAMGFGLKISKFFLGMLLSTLHAAIAEYIDECESYLGRPIGSHEARNRVIAVVREVLLAIPGLFNPLLGFLAPAKEAWTQLRNSPRKVDRDLIRDATQTWEALITFRDRLTELHGHRWYIEGIVQTSVDGVLGGIGPIPKDEGPSS